MNEDLTKRVEALETILGRGNFIARTVQQKDAVFNGRLKLINRASTPANAQVGEICFAAGHFNVCKTANTWTQIT